MQLVEEATTRTQLPNLPSIILETDITKPCLVTISFLSHSNHTIAVVEDSDYAAGSQVLTDKVYEIFRKLV